MQYVKFDQIIFFNMLTKSEINLFSKLKQKKFRKTEKLFIAEGKRMLEEALKSNVDPKLISVTAQFAEREADFIKSLEKNKIRPETIKSKDIEKICSTKNPQGIFAVFEIPDESDYVFDDKTVIGLENISDPGNLGTILRSCTWFGIRSVVLDKECAEIYNPKVLRSSMGAVFKLNIKENINLIDTNHKLKEMNFQSLVADMKGEDYRSINFNKKTILNFCNEANGPSEDLKKVCNTSITIPGKGEIDSLNVAAAAAVILSRFV